MKLLRFESHKNMFFCRVWKGPTFQPRKILHNKRPKLVGGWEGLYFSCTYYPVPRCASRSRPNDQGGRYWILYNRTNPGTTSFVPTVVPADWSTMIPFGMWMSWNPWGVAGWKRGTQHSVPIYMCMSVARFTYLCCTAAVALRGCFRIREVWVEIVPLLGQRNTWSLMWTLW